MAKQKRSRVKFPRGKQRLFIDGIIGMSDLRREELSKICNIDKRTLSDWYREKSTMSYSALLNLCKNYNISMSSEIKILPPFWYVNKAARLGALVRNRLYGNLGTPEGRRKGGLATQRLIKMNPEWALQSGIIVRKRIHDPGHSLELAEFIGIMLGDGGVTNYQLNITLNSQTDKEYLAYVKNLLEKLFSIKARVMLRKKEIAACIVASGRNLVELVQKYGLKVGNKVRQSVDIPLWILDTNEFSVTCLRGLMDTDGSCYAYTHTVNKKRYHNFAICFTNASPALLKSVYTILDRNGYHPCVTGRRVYIYKKDEIAKYFQKVGSHNSKHLRKYQRFIDSKVLLAK